MFTSLAFFLTSDEDESEAESDNTQQLNIIKKVLRTRVNPLDYPDEEFIQKFRMSKVAFRYVFAKIDCKMKTCRSTAIPPLLKFATTLRILAEDDYQQHACNDLHLGLAQPTVSKIFGNVIDILETEICPKWITINMSEAEKAAIKLDFFEKTGFPGIIGCIDGMHVKIVKPKTVNDQNLCSNKYSSYSLNAMIVCDHKMFIRFVDARHHGSSTDAQIWKKSELRQALRKKLIAGETNMWLLGDSEYPLEPILITPFKDAKDASPESLFNSAHENARSIINKTILVLKNRFRCLLGRRFLHYEPAKVTKMVNACAALHNICMHFDGKSNFVDGAEFLEEETDNDLPECENIDENRNNELAETIRNQIMEAMAYIKSEPQ